MCEHNSTLVAASYTRVARGEIIAVYGVVSSFAVKNFGEPRLRVISVGDERDGRPRDIAPRKSAFVSHVHCGASFKTFSHPRGGGPIGGRAPRPRDLRRPIDATGFEILWSLFTGLLVSTQRCLSSVKGDPCRCTFIHGRCAENRATRS